MRHVLDCAMLALPQHENWLSKVVEGVRRQSERLVLHSFTLSPASETDAWPDPLELQQWTLQFRRFDVLVLPVSVPSLAWTRTLLSNAEGLDLPIIALCHRVSLPGIKDLLLLGADDFACTPVAADELRLRCQRVMRGAPARKAADLPWPDSGPPASLSLQEPALYAGPFQEAKARVVTAFEQRYLNTMLHAHEGNISRAARAANKNRRAFWELLRKHEISASGYRDAARYGCESPLPFEYLDQKIQEGLDMGRGGAMGMIQRHDGGAGAAPVR